jgi:ferredoxin
MKATGVEKRFLARARRHGDRLVSPTEQSAPEGFEYFASAAYKAKLRAEGTRVPIVFLENGIRGFSLLLMGFARNLLGVLGGIRRSFADVEPYLSQLETRGTLPSSAAELVASAPNPELWEELESYAWDTHRVVIGFTTMPAGFVFQGKAALYRHALVLVMEMAKAPIDKAPEVDAGVEVITIYNRLGQATNDIARWLRDRGVACMANHPLGGLVDTTPLAEKAGLGAIGHSGLLITPQYGPRCRIAPIFVDQPLFAPTDSDRHRWVEDFCDSCHRCEKGCPMDAILSEHRVTAHYGDGVRDREACIDRERCHLYFSRTMGCALCIKLCPFSKPGTYDRLAQRLERKGDSAPS